MADSSSQHVNPVAHSRASNPHWPISPGLICGLLGSNHIRLGTTAENTCVDGPSRDSGGRTVRGSVFSDHHSVCGGLWRLYTINRWPGSRRSGTGSRSIHECHLGEGGVSHVDWIVIDYGWPKRRLASCADTCAAADRVRRMTELLEQAETVEESR
jgi:hypothetical protein